MSRKAFAFVLMAGLFATPAGAQLVGERVDGVYRICVYGGSGNLVGAGPRAHRVGFAESCPSTPPPPLTNFGAPPSAALLSDIIAVNVRRCVYEQAGQQWVFDLPVERYCPLAAGALVEERRRADRR